MVAAPALSSKPPCRIPSSDPGGQGPSPQAPLPWVTVRVTAASAPGRHRPAAAPSELHTDSTICTSAQRERRAVALRDAQVGKGPRHCLLKMKPYETFLAVLKVLGWNPEPRACQASAPP